MVLETRQRALGPTTAALVRAAEERGIPWLRLDDRSLVQLGHGKYQRRIQASTTSETRQIAAEIASDKRLTHRILEGLGLPVSRHPSGNDYRILVVNGHMVAVAERAPGRVIDRTDSIHYDNRVMAERAVQAIGLDVAGVDFISPDISRSYKDVGGAIVEINAAPGFRMHLADDPRVAQMAGHSRAEPIYVTLDHRSELVRRHIRERKRAVVLEEGLNGPMIVLYQGEEQSPLLWARQIPATVEGRAVHNIQNAMFAAAIASGLGVGVHDIHEGLRTFTTDFFQTPGRLSPKDAPVREEMLAEASTRGPARE